MARSPRARRPHSTHRRSTTRLSQAELERRLKIVGSILFGLLLAGLMAQFNEQAALVSINRGDGGSGWTIGEVQVEAHELFDRRSLTEVRDYALELVNRDRQLNGLTPLRRDPILEQAAQLHAEDMLARQFYDHINPDGQDPSDRVRALGGQQGAGENIMHQWTTQGFDYKYLSYELIEQFQKEWMYSDGHRQNLLLPDYQTFGYGIVVSQESQEIFAVQLFSY